MVGFQVIKSTNTEPDETLIGTSPKGFIEYYNKNIPDTFPVATIKTLNAFKAQYPSLFKEDGQWIIQKHRKKFMDWHASHSD